MKATELEQIAEQIKVCRTCRRGKVGLPVPGEGSSSAQVFFVGEAPGRQEAKTGRPFVGRAGKILRQMIEDIGLRPEDVYITSPVKYLPKHVTPTPAEVSHGMKHLNAQLNIVEPKVVVLLGRVAVLGVLGRDIEVAKEHGTIIKKDSRHYFITYHPAAQIYSRKLIPVARQDFTRLKRLIDAGENLD